LAQFKDRNHLVVAAPRYVSVRAATPGPFGGGILSPAKASKKNASKIGASKTKRPMCGTCGKRIHVPKGWSMLPAVRRHYWSHHREVMQPNLTKNER
jgi:hypothetical protein